MKAAQLLAFLVLVSVPAAAKADGPPAGDPLAALAWFVGGTWVSEIKSPDGRALRVETNFHWAGHGRALKYVVHFHGAERAVPQYEGMYFWHPGKKHVAMVQVDRSGNLTESVITVEGETVTQENQATAADGTTRPQRVTVTRRGEDAFEFKASVQREGEWVEAVALTYERRRDAADGKKPSP